VLWILLLLLAGCGALTWSIISITRRARNVRMGLPPLGAPRGPDSRALPPQSAPSSAPSTIQVKEVIAIIGGVVSILVGLLSIIEKIRGLL
jgi:hypothetical protein